MFCNYQFSFKKVKDSNILFYYFISIFLINFCFCTTYDGYLSDFVNEETAHIDNKELIRRRKLAESYFRETDDAQSDWIETYASFVESSDPTLRKANQEGMLENEEEIHITHPSLYPFQYVDFSSFESSEDTVKSYESMNLSSGKNSKDGPKSFKKTTGNILQQSFIASINNEENQQLLKDNNDQMCISNVLKEKPKSNNFKTKKPRKKVLFKSESNKLNNSHIYHEIALKDIDDNIFVYSNSEKYMCSNYNTDNKSDSLIKQDSAIKNSVFQLEKFIEIIITNSELISEKYFINSASLTLTEFKTLQKNLARLSILQKSKNNVYSINRMNIIDSMSKLTPLSKKDEFIKEKPQCKFSNLNDEISIESVQDKVNAVKKSVNEFKKRASHKLSHEKNLTPKRITHSSFSESTNNEKFIQSIKLENTANNDFSHNSEMLRRKKLMNIFLTTLNTNQKDWVETYDFSYISNESEENVLSSSIGDNFKERENDYNLHKTSEQVKEYSKVHFYERSYVTRWINRLNNKVKESQCSYCSHSILVSGNSLKILGRLSQEFDIVIFDQLVTSMISNITINSNAENMLYFYYENALNAVLLYLNYRTIFIIIALLFSYIFLCSLFSNTKHNFTLYRILNFSMHFKLIILITLLSFSLYWHGNKMYQQKIAQKHNVMSRVVPSYCESILKQESGILAHFKEYFRKWFHDEDCKKYYEAVMVDPSKEISPLSITTDLFSEAIFQMFQPFGRNINLFFKALTKDLSFLQQIFIPIFTVLILVVILCFFLMFLAVRWNYKVYFPFHMGSVEPTKFSVGSRVQEVEEKECFCLKDCSTSGMPQITYKSKIDNKNHVEDIILEENSFIIESKHFKLDPSKYRVLKISRSRHNSI